MAIPLSVTHTLQKIDEYVESNQSNRNCIQSDKERFDRVSFFMKVGITVKHYAIDIYARWMVQVPYGST
jgi:hypothetical protein